MDGKLRKKPLSFMWKLKPYFAFKSLNFLYKILTCVFTKVEKTGPDQPVQPENRSTGPLTGPAQHKNRPFKNRAQNR